MRFNLLGLLLLFIPAAFLMLGTRTWIEKPLIEWHEFDLEALDSSLKQYNSVVVHVRSAYGFPGDKWIETFLQDTRVQQAIANRTLLLSTFEFRYVTRAPAGLEEEYAWTYEQNIYIKDAFFALYQNDEEIRLYQWHEDAGAAVDSLNLIDWEWRYRLLSGISLVAVVAYFVWIGRKPRVARLQTGELKRSKRQRMARRDDKSCRVEP